MMHHTLLFSTTENTTPVNVLRSKQSQDNTFLILAIVLATLVVLTFFFIYRFVIAKRMSRCQVDKCQIIPRTAKYQPLQTGKIKELCIIWVLNDDIIDPVLRICEMLKAAQ
jgi:ABC-type phosphate transport system permease subunit